jgi:DegV family protein with EDD domain
MQIVSDRGLDLANEQLQGLDFHQVPLILTLDGKSYRSGEDIQPEEFYKLLDQSEGYPTTSQPSAGDFAELYRRLAASDPDILSIHISSGLSGTYNSALAGAAMVPEANVTVIDSLTLSCPMGWQVEAAAWAVQAGWSKEQVIQLLDQVRAVSEGMFTLATLKYLIHGGRISHLKGLVASLLNIKPIIGVEKVRGTYVTHGQERTLKRAIQKLAEIAVKWHSTKGKLRVQVLHGNNIEGAELLCEQLSQLVDCVFLPTTTIAPVLGAHTGPGLVGLAFAPVDRYPDIPFSGKMD